MVNTLFFDTPALTEKIEDQTTISLAKVRKGDYMGFISIKIR